MNLKLSEFMEACGAAGPLLVDVLGDGDTHRARRILHQPFFVCGRHADSDLQLRHDRVGRRHCYFQLVDGHLFGVDLGSRSGIRVDGEPRRWGWIGRAQELAIGPVGLSLRAGDDDGGDWTAGSPSPLSARYAAAHPVPEASLEISSAGGEPHRWRMNRVLVLVGRTAACKLKLISPLVADVHCALIRTATGVWMVDLLSPGGVYVDGDRMRFCRLEEGNELSIGPFSIRLRHEARTRPRSSRAGTAPPEATVHSSKAAVESPYELDGMVRSSRNVSAAVAAEAPMSEQLRQIVMMARVYCAMHDDQRVVVREDCEEIRRLADEIRALRAELAARPAADAPIEAGSRLPAVDFGAAIDETAAVFQPGPAMSEVPVDEDAFYQREVSSMLKRDPQELHAIASQFLRAYNLERLSLREKILRIVLGQSDVRPMMR